MSNGEGARCVDCLLASCWCWRCWQVKILLIFFPFFWFVFIFVCMVLFEFSFESNYCFGANLNLNLRGRGRKFVMRLWRNVSLEVCDAWWRRLRQHSCYGWICFWYSSFVWLVWLPSNCFLLFYCFLGVSFAVLDLIMQDSCTYLSSRYSTTNESFYHTLNCYMNLCKMFLSLLFNPLFFKPERFLLIVDTQLFRFIITSKCYLLSYTFLFFDFYLLQPLRPWTGVFLSSLWWQLTLSPFIFFSTFLYLPRLRYTVFS